MSDNNGWPGEPGVPLNPERDGWHWLKTPKGRFYSCWWNAIRWIETYPLGSSIDEVWRPAECAYVGPCLTPAEVDARVAQARRDALERAALAAENEPEPEGDPPPELHGRSVKNIATASVRATKRNIVAAIRALKGEGND